MYLIYLHFNANKRTLANLIFTGYFQLVTQVFGFRPMTFDPTNDGVYPFMSCCSGLYKSICYPLVFEK